jgi:type IV pilus assembly protein PilC
MVYQYVACSEAGEMVKGRLTAASEDAVNDMLSYAGYRLINLKPYVPFFSADRLTGQFSKIKPSEVILFYRQLALLLESGTNIITSIELLHSQTTNKGFKLILADVVSELRAGHQLSMAMNKHVDIFTTLCCRSLSIGEQTGGIEVMLKQVAEYMEKEIVAKKSIKGALTYPAIVSVATIIVVGVLVGFVLPAFAGLYSELGAELPAITRVMISISDVFRSNFLAIFMAIMVVVSVAVIYGKTADGKYTVDKLVLRLPLIGRIQHMSELARMCRSISLLFTAGLPLTEIMPLVIEGTTNRVMARALYGVQQDMLKGEGLSLPMSKNPLFLPMIVQMVKVGEETGSLDNSLVAVAKNYETESEDKTKALIAMIQPAMTLVIAGIVGLVALSMFSAMYSMYGQAF